MDMKTVRWLWGEEGDGERVQGEINGDGGKIK